MKPKIQTFEPKMKLLLVQSWSVKSSKKYTFGIFKGPKPKNFFKPNPT